MTEQIETLQILTTSTATPTLTINREDAAIHLAILGDRQDYWILQKNFTTEQNQVKAYHRDEILKVAEQANQNGYSFWISLNPKTDDGNQYVTHFTDYWLDIDARPSGVTDRPATTQELATAKQNAETLQNYFKQQYNAKCFIACSGNGYHLHFPLPITELVESSRLEVNTKIRNFTTQIVNATGVKVDICTDLNRKTTLIGTFNLKLPKQPLQTYWLPECLPQDIYGAIDYNRTENMKLLQNIITLEPAQPNKAQNTAVYNSKNIRPCIVEALKKQLTGGNGHKMRLSVAAELKRDGHNSEEQIIDLFRGQTDFNYSETAKGVLSADPTRTARCDTIKVYGFCLYSDDMLSCPWRTRRKNNSEKEEFNPVLLAKEIMSTHVFVIEEESRMLFVYDEKEGFYRNRKIAAETIKREMTETLDEKTRARYYNDVAFYIENKAPIKPICTNPELILCQNGILNVLTRELVPLSAEQFIVNKIPVTYNPTATCPKINAFLEQTLDEKQRLVAQEFTGDCLYRKNINKKAYVAFGEHDTGKTQHQIIVTKFLGEDNISNRTIQDINQDRFACGRLYLKMANFCDDMPPSLIKVTGNFKTITGGGRLSGEDKCADSFEFTPYAKFWINCNKLPPISKYEDEDSYYGRLLVICYMNMVKPENKIRDYAATICTQEEFSGLLNSALDGLQRLHTKGEYSEYLSIDETKTFYLKQTNPCKAFIDQNITTTNEYDDNIFHNDLFRELVKFCHTENIKPIPNKGELTKAMNDHCIGAQYTKIRKTIGHDNDKPILKLEPAWRYIKIVPNVPFVQGVSHRSQENNDNMKKTYYTKNFDTDKKIVAQKEQNEQMAHDFHIIAYCVPLKEDSHPDQACSVCQEKKPLTYTYRTYDGKDGYACLECGDKIRCHIDRRD